jgi:hypothetical protein
MDVYSEIYNEWFYLINRCYKNVQLQYSTLKPTGYLMHHQVQHSSILPSSHSVFMGFVFISELPATFVLNNTN